jgi:hypothetical protein
MRAGWLVIAAAGFASSAHAETRVGLAAVGGMAGFAAGSEALIGSEGSLAWWRGAFGVAAEGAAAARTDTLRNGALWLGASARFRVLRRHAAIHSMDGKLTPLALDLDVETIVQHEWWDFDPSDARPPERTAYGFGIATSIGTDAGTTVCGLRAAIRVMVAPERATDVATRMISPDPAAHREFGVLVSIGTELGRRD